MSQQQRSVYYLVVDKNAGVKIYVLSHNIHSFNTAMDTSLTRAHERPVKFCLVSDFPWGFSDFPKPNNSLSSK